MSSFIEKNKVPFNSVKNLVVNRVSTLTLIIMKEEINSACDFGSGEVSEDNIDDSEVAQEIDDKRAKLKDNKLEGKFFSKNVINLSQRDKTKINVAF